MTIPDRSSGAPGGVSTSSFYVPSDSLLSEIESIVRTCSTPVKLISTNYTCSISYYYQSILPEIASTHSAKIDVLVPVFSLVHVAEGVVGTCATSYMFTDIEEKMSISQSTHVPVTVTDCCVIEDPQFLDLLGIYNLKNKKTKRLNFTFKLFGTEGGGRILIGANLFSVVGCNEILLELMPTLKLNNGVLEMHNLDLNLGRLRPINRNELRFPFHIFELAKWKDTVTIPRPGTPELITFSAK